MRFVVQSWLVNEFYIVYAFYVIVHACKKRLVFSGYDVYNTDKMDTYNIKYKHYNTIMHALYDITFVTKL